ncbi:MAG: hypothetical protein RML15_04125 [Bacteroidota bacterium]|nr:hypothetical protein [Candidatus Kapabacteria bacterium]MCS7301909.1 hypothetical protein [Candidatus Kapabacteria bacterium]MCX7936162.1 hypothetical protein [Chlorobiota bacterium]MDW8074944.1 hypothetical protein [Bacteroidota bacterium]MDW8271583.1 hypothetical protein [Bacteroidota bacterium]
MAQREIPHYHEFVAKDQRPSVGHTYRWYLGGDYVYTARVVEFRGGCWARVQVIESAPQHTSVYTPGAEFEIKIAHYRYEAVPERSSSA